MEILLSIATLVVGFSACVVSASIAKKFSELRPHLADESLELLERLTWQLRGEAFMSFVTLIFSVTSFVGALEFIPVEVQNIMRMTMFLAVTLTSIRLRNTITRIKLINP